MAGRERTIDLGAWRPSMCHKQLTGKSMAEIFSGSFTQQEPLPQAAMDAAMQVLQSGRLHRYNLVGDEEGEVSLLEAEFAQATGAKYCLAVASGGYAIGCALRALGVRSGDKVLTNAFTLAPVPGAIAGLGAVPVFVGVTEDLVIDLDHLESQIASSGAGVLLLSHMRGHICDMDRLMSICDAADVRVVEDCAHTMGARWNGVYSGRHGVMAAYSTQTYKHINSGEGGLLVCDDPDLAARAVLLSGSYMLYERHGAAPAAEAFEQAKWVTPNISGRMDHLRAAILRPQLADLDNQVRRWNERYRVMEAGLRGVAGIKVIERPQAEAFVGSSIQFLLPGRSPDQVRAFISSCAARGVELKWFGADVPTGFTSTYKDWKYAPSEVLEASDRILAGLMDMRLPLTFSLDDCALIGRIIAQEAAIS